MVLSICWSVSPSPSMMDVLVSTVGLTDLACLRTLKDWSKFALGSRTCLEKERQKLKEKKKVVQSPTKDLADDFPLVAEVGYACASKR